MPRFRHKLLSESDSLANIQKKMELWISNGVQLGWLIDPYQKRVFIYEPGVEVSVICREDTSRGTGR